MKNSIWKRTKAKKSLIKLLPSLNLKDIFFYKEIENEIIIRYTYQQILIKKSELNKYLDPIKINGKIDEVSNDLSIYLDEIIKKNKKQKIL